MHNSIIFFNLFITVNKLDSDQIMDKLQCVRSKEDGKINVSEIVESVNLFMAIEWGNYKRWTNSISSWIENEERKKGNLYIYIYIYSGYPFLKGDSPRFNCTQYFRCNMVKERIILSS